MRPDEISEEDFEAMNETQKVIPPEVSEAASAMAKKGWEKRNRDPKKFSEWGKRGMANRWGKKRKKKKSSRKKKAKTQKK